MATIFTNIDQTKTTDGTPVYHLGNGDRLMVGPDAVLATTGGTSPVVLAGTSLTLHLMGDLLAGQSDAVAAGARADIRIDASGSITAMRDGIDLSPQHGGDNEVANAGSIQAEEYAIRFGLGGVISNTGLLTGGGGITTTGGLELTNGGTIQAFGSLDGLGWPGLAVEAEGSARIVNSGTIASARGGAIQVGSSLTTASLDLVNTGLISGDSWYGAISSQMGADRVVNSGTIIGTVRLGAGDDLYDGTLGQLQGLLLAYEGDDTLLGGAGRERLDGGDGDDEIAGHGGADTLLGKGGNDSVAGGEGDDEIAGGDGMDLLDGGAGADILSYDGSAAAVRVNLGTGDAAGGAAEGDVFSGFEGLRGSEHDDTLTGSSAADRLIGGDGNDSLIGGSGADRLTGGDGADTLTGNGGLDVLAGGKGADLFRFSAASDSKAAMAERDRIVDFDPADGDRIGLSVIDADTTLAGNQEFAFIGGDAFGGVAGQLRAIAEGGTTKVFADLDGDGAADFALMLSGSMALTAADFVL